MATIIDTLIIKLGLDSSQFKTGSQNAQQQVNNTKAAATGAAKEMEVRGKQAGMFFSQIRNQALGLIAVILGGKGIMAFATSTAASLTKVGQSATSLRVATQDLTAFQMAVKANGGSAEAATSSLQALGGALDDWNVLGPNSNVAKFFSQIKADATDTPMQAYMRFVQFVQDNKGDIPLQNVVGQGLGLSPDAIALARRGVDQVKRDIQDAKDLGAPTGAQSERFSEFNRQLERMRQAFEGIATTLLDRFIPFMTAASKATADFIRDNKGLSEGLLAVAGIIATIGAIKMTGWAARLFGVGGAAAGEAAGVGFLARIGAGLAAVGRFAGRAAGPVGFLYGILHSNEANAGEAEELKRLRNGGSAPGVPATADQLEKPEFSGFGGFIRRFFPTANQAAADRGGRAGDGPTDLAPLRELVAKAEGTAQTQGYNTTLGNGAYSGGQQNLVGMTLDQIDALQTKMLQHPDNKFNSSALGMFQVTQTTLRDLRNKMNLSGDTKYDKETQDRIFAELVRTRVNGTMQEMQDGLAKVWASIPTASTGRPFYANQQRMGVSNEEAQRALRSSTSGQRPGSTADGQKQSSVNIESITIQTAATDARGIARELPGAIRAAHMNYRVS